MDIDTFSARLTAIASSQRLRIVAALHGNRVHVSELARRVEMSRPLLYMHLSKLQDAGFVTSELELDPEGRALKFFELVPFRITIDPATVAALDPSETASPPNRKSL